MPWNGAQHAIKCGDGVSRPILWVSISKVSCLETLNIAKKLFIKISAIQRFLFVVFAGRKQPKHIEKCQKFEKSQVRSDNEILWKISAKFTNSEVSVLNFKSRVSEFLLQVSSLGRLDSDFFESGSNLLFQILNPNPLRIGHQRDTFNPTPVWLQFIICQTNNQWRFFSKNKIQCGCSRQKLTLDPVWGSRRPDPKMQNPVYAHFWTADYCKTAG